MFGKKRGAPYPDSSAAGGNAPGYVSPPDGSQAAFPPLGSTLPAYASQGYDGRLPAPVRPPAGYRPPADKPSAGDRFKTAFKRLVIFLLILAVLACGYVGYKFLQNAGKTFGGNLFGLFRNEQLLGEESGRVNILLAGNSADDVGHSGGDLTDSIMVVSVDTVNHTAFMLSIPRDLWVEVPGNGYSKINSAYVYGKADKFNESGYPLGGMGTLEKIIETNLAIDIHYYALVNYTALRESVDAVGGIDVTIASSDPRGLYDPSIDWSQPGRPPLVRLSNGNHRLDGRAALNLARARGDAYGSYGYGMSDFTRTANQRLILAALKEKAVSAGVLANPVKVGNLLDSIGDNVQTDFRTEEVRRLAEIAREVPGGSIKSYSLNDIDGKNMLTSYRTYNGQSALVPALGVDNYSAIQEWLDGVMAPPVEADGRR